MRNNPVFDEEKWQEEVWGKQKKRTKERGESLKNFRKYLSNNSLELEVYTFPDSVEMHEARKIKHYTCKGDKYYIIVFVDEDLIADIVLLQNPDYKHAKKDYGFGRSCSQSEALKYLKE